jgi:hypothetical protein
MLTRMMAVELGRHKASLLFIRNIGSTCSNDAQFLKGLREANVASNGMRLDLS